MWNNFFKHIDIDPANVHILDGNAPNLHEECDEFERKITEAGGVDLFIGGEKVKRLLFSAVHFPSLLSCRTQQYLVTKFSYPCSFMVCSQQKVAVVGSSCLHVYISFCKNPADFHEICWDFTKLCSTFQLRLK
jgi:hypothetical protein